MLRNINEILIKNQKVKLKIYSLNYYILLKNNIYMMYPKYYENDRHTSSTLEDLLSNFYIYNESVLDNLSKIKIINE